MMRCHESWNVVVKRQEMLQALSRYASPRRHYVPLYNSQFVSISVRQSRSPLYSVNSLVAAAVIRQYDACVPTPTAAMA